MAGQQQIYIALVGVQSSFREVWPNLWDSQAVSSESKLETILKKLEKLILSTSYSKTFRLRIMQKQSRTKKLKRQKHCGTSD